MRQPDLSNFYSRIQSRVFWNPLRVHRNSLLANVWAGAKFSPRLRRHGPLWMRLRKVKHPNFGHTQLVWRRVVQPWPLGQFNGRKVR